MMSSENVTTSPERIHIIRYQMVEPRKKAGVAFDGVLVGYVLRVGLLWTWAKDIKSTGNGFRYHTRGEAATALVRSVRPDWKGVAP